MAGLEVGRPGAGGAGAQGGSARERGGPVVVEVGRRLAEPEPAGRSRVAGRRGLGKRSRGAMASERSRKREAARWSKATAGSAAVGEDYPIRRPRSLPAHETPLGGGGRRGGGWSGLDLARDGRRRHGGGEVAAWRSGSKPRRGRAGWGKWLGLGAGKKFPVAMAHSRALNKFAGNAMPCMWP